MSFNQIEFDKLSTRVKKYAFRLDKLLLNAQSFFYFIIMLFAFMIPLLLAMKAIEFLIAEGEVGFVKFLLLMVLAIIYGFGNFATARLLILTGNDIESYEYLWEQKKVFIPFTLIIFLTIPSLFLDSVGLINKIIIFIQLYIWFIFYNARGLLKGHRSIKEYVKDI